VWGKCLSLGIQFDWEPEERYLLTETDGRALGRISTVYLDKNVILRAFWGGLID